MLVHCEKMCKQTDIFEFEQLWTQWYTGSAYLHRRKAWNTEIELPSLFNLEQVLAKQSRRH